MSELKVNDKVTAIDTARRYHVLQMKKGASGTITKIESERGLKRDTSIEVEVATVELPNGELVKVELSNLKPYEKKVIVKLEDLPNKELLWKYGELLRSEQHGSMKTKAYQKRLVDIERCEAEMMKRMGGE